MTIGNQPPGAGSGGGGEATPEFTSTVNKWGAQVDIDVADANAGQVIWPIKATVQQYSFIDSPIVLTLQSDNAADTAAGTGAQEIQGMYHDDSGESKSFTLAMNGVTPVPLPTNSYGVFRMFVSATGSGNTNAGTITIENGGTVYAQINPGEGQTEIAVLRIPNNRTARVTRHRVRFQATAGFFAGSDDATMRLKVRKTDGTEIIKWNPIITTENPIDDYDYQIGGIDLNPGEWVYWECVGVSAANTPIQASFDVGLNNI